jgi:hypothetical protein
LISELVNSSNALAPIISQDYDEFNPKMGYYRVGNQRIGTKIPALIEGTKQNIHPEWIFNNHVFDQVDWSIEPSEDIYQLYGQRAKQLREKYDYIILMYSAGSDSETVLNAFLRNGLEPDEIVVTWALGLENAYKPDPTDFRPDNLLSEWNFTVKPRLEQIAKDYPNIKITLNNWTEDYDKVQIPEDYLLTRHINLAPFAGKRWSFHNIHSISESLIKHQNAVVLWGQDKPRVCINNGFFCFYFIDVACQAHYTDLRNGKHSEYFFWNPDCVKMLTKQAHLVVKFFENNPRFQTYINWPINNPSWRNFYDQVVRAVIYPELDLNFFQASKYKALNYASDSALFLIDPGIKQKLIQMNKENFDYLQPIINQKYFQRVDDTTINFVGFVSGMWPIKSSVDLK